MNKYYSITSFTTDVAAALVDRYGAGVTIHYSVGSTLIFTCPAISGKVIKFDGGYLSAGDAYVSSTTISNPTACGGYNNEPNSFLSLGDSFMLFHCSADYMKHFLYLVGKLDNGRTIAAAHVGNTSYLTYAGGQIFAVDGQKAGVAKIYTPNIIGRASGKLFKSPVYFACEGEIEMVTAEDPATISGLYAVTMSDDITPIKAPDYLITPSKYYGPTGVCITNNLLIELTP